MKDKKIEIAKIKNKGITALQYAKGIVAGNHARTYTSYDYNIKSHLLWRSVAKNATALFHYKNYCKVRGQLCITKNMYYRTNETQTAYEFKKIERNQNATKDKLIRTLWRSSKNAKDIINANVTLNTKFLTLTYRENVTDLKRVYKDFNLFSKNFANFAKKNNIEYEYTRAIEPQERGAWHLHILIYTDEPFIDNSEIFKIWNKGQELSKSLTKKGSKEIVNVGWVKTQSLKNKENPGAYITSYLTDLEPLPNETKKEKQKRKGQRLGLYPAHMKIFSHSKGVKKPTILQPTLFGDLETELNDLGFEISKNQPKNAYQIISTASGEVLKEYNYVNFQKPIEKTNKKKYNKKRSKTNEKQK